jgi:ribonuclease G
MQFLSKLWESIREQKAKVQPGTMVHGDLPLVMRILRDLLGTEVERVRIDSREGWQRLVEFAERFVPEMQSRIEMYEGDGPIFDLYGIEDEIQRSLERKVPLKSGGYLIFDQTEAMTTIDVNTGGYVGHRNLEETILKTNLEAAQALARQLRLRNLGGIIIIDFIDMHEEEHRHLVVKALEKALARDPARTVISEMSALGLVQMTRKRTRESLEHILCEPCPTCSGRGTVKTVETVCNEIFREILRSARQFDAKELVVLAAPDVVARLLDEQSTTLAELSEQVHKPVKLQAESLYTQENFDVILM